jgi:hypothetical protein
MSYTEYLRRKAAAAPVIVDTRLKLDASSFTNRVRLAASSDFAMDGQKYGSITNVTDPNSGGNNGNHIHAIASYKKVAGGRVPDASAFTAASGSAALANQQLVPTPRRYLLNSNDAGSLSGCIVIPNPVADKTASSFTNSLISCHQLKGEQHSTNATTYPSPPVFVDNTTRFCATANHVPPADMPHNTFLTARPAKSAQPILVTPSPSDARKVGDFNPRRIPYVEKHHGNEMIGHIQYPKTPYRIPSGTAAQLKINDPMHYPGTM